MKTNITIVSGNTVTVLTGAYTGQIRAATPALQAIYGSDAVIHTGEPEKMSINQLLIQHGYNKFGDKVEDGETEE